MEKILHFTVPEKLTPVQAQTIERARVLHPGWDVKVWQDPVQPDGYLLEQYWPKVNSGAQFADLLRLDLVYKWGGIYIDSDMRLLKALDSLSEKYDFFIASEDGECLTNALFGAVKAHPAIRTIIDELLSHEPDWSLRPDITTGPYLFGRTLKWNNHVAVLPRETFYSYNGYEHPRRIHRHSYGEHLWVHSWKAQAGNQPHSFNWRSVAKRLVKPALTTGFGILHRIKSLDPLKELKFYAISAEIVVKTIHGFNVVLDGNDARFTPELIFGGRYPLAEENFAKRILRGGDWAIDVGSKVGFSCLLAAQSVDSFGRVFAYDPNPKTLKLLSKSITMNRMHDRIIVRPVAVGAVAGHMPLIFEGLEGARTGFKEVGESACNDALTNVGARPLIDVPSVTLDEEFPVDLPIKLLKIDVEGYEGAILKGARRLLERRCINFILIELPKKAVGSRWGELMTQLNLLTEKNYTPCTLQLDGALIDHKSVDAALNRLERRNIVLMARDQYIFVE